METKIKKVDKYLTDLKELPVEEAEVKDVVRLKTKTKKEEMVRKVEDVVSKAKANSDSVVDNVKNGQNQGLSALPLTTDDQESDAKFDDTEDKPFTSKDIILGSVNFLSVVFLIFLLMKLPSIALELKGLREESVRNSQGNILSVNSEDSIKKSGELKKLFLDDFGVVNFTVDIEKLKAVSPAIKRVTFTSQKPIKDRLGFSGVPAVIVLEGNWNSIGQAMNAIESLPYLFRPVSIKSEVSKEDPSVIVLNYGGILYVGEQFAKN